MTLLVTGCAGFIGSNFVHYYLNKYPDRRIVGIDDLTYAGNIDNLTELLKEAARDPVHVSRSDKSVPNQEMLTASQQPSSAAYRLSTDSFVFVKGNICNASLVSSIFGQYEIDGVINFAAESHVDRSINDPQVFLKTNILGAQVLLDVAKKHWQLPGGKWRTIGLQLAARGMQQKINRTREQGNSAVGGQQPAKCKFLQISTDEVYGSLGPTGLFTEQTPLDPHSPYSASKASADLIVKAYYETYGLPVNITRSSNNYGPYQFPEKLIPLMIKNALNHKPLPVYGDGRQIRDWLYVIDHCKAIDLVFTSGRIGEIYNIGGDNERENMHIVKQIIATLREKTDDPDINSSLIRHVTDRLGHDRRYGVDSSKISTTLGWRPEMSFDEGIRVTIDWYLNSKRWLERIASGEYRLYQ